MRPPATLEEVLRVLREKQPEARALGIELVGVVGSIARGDARPDSDIDVLTIWQETTLLKVGAAMALIEDAVGRPADLIDSKMLPPSMRARMEADLVRL